MIRVQNVTRWYGSTLAVDDVSFEIGRDEIVGFLGPNGAGKSTLLKMLSTWLAPSAGKLSVAGADVQSDAQEARRQMGYLPEHNALYESMRVDRLLQFVGRIRGLTGQALRERTGWVVDRCTLDPVLGKRVHQCSKGFRQRIGVATALIHDPPVLILDEPTHGLDPLQVVAFRDFIRSLRSGRTILFSSHILSEVASISDRLLVIHRGKLMADAPLETLKERASKRGLDLEGLFVDLVSRQQEVGS